MLETIREYALERLDDSDASEGARRAHAEHFLGLASQIRPDFVRFSQERQRAGLMLLDRERDNLQAAMEWTLQAASDMALPLAVALRTYWLIRGYRRQAMSWLERALALPVQAAPGLRAEAAAGAALFARLGGEFDRAVPLAEEAVELGRRPEDAVAVVTGLNVLVTLAGRAGDFEQARALSEESVAVGRDAGSARLEAVACFILAEALVNGGRYADAIEPATRSLELARTIDDPEVTSLALGRLGAAAAGEGRLEEARALLVESFELACVIRFEGLGATFSDLLALIAAASGDLRAPRVCSEPPRRCDAPWVHTACPPRLPHVGPPLRPYARRLGRTRSRPSSRSAAA